MSENASEIMLTWSWVASRTTLPDTVSRSYFLGRGLQPGCQSPAWPLVNGLNANLLRKWITQYQDLVDTPITAVATTQAAAVTLVPVTQLNETVPIESRETGRDQDSTVAQS